MELMILNFLQIIKFNIEKPPIELFAVFNNIEINENSNLCNIFSEQENEIEKIANYEECEEDKNDKKSNINSIETYKNKKKKKSNNLYDYLNENYPDFIINAIDKKELDTYGHWCQHNDVYNGIYPCKKSVSKFVCSNTLDKNIMDRVKFLEKQNSNYRAINDCQLQYLKNEIEKIYKEYILKNKKTIDLEFNKNPIFYIGRYLFEFYCTDNEELHLLKTNKNRGKVNCYFDLHLKNTGKLLYVISKDINNQIIKKLNSYILENNDEKVDVQKFDSYLNNCKKELNDEFKKTHYIKLLVYISDKTNQDDVKKKVMIKN